MSKHLGFREFIIVQNGIEINEINRVWADKLISSSSEENVHDGDCTKVACSCMLCCLETMLSEYREYRFAKTPMCQFCDEEIPLAEYNETATIPAFCKHCSDKYHKRPQTK